MGAGSSTEPRAPTLSGSLGPVRVTTDISYGEDHPNSYLDVYRVDQPPTGRPTVLALHGGGFITGSKSVADPLTRTPGTCFALGHGPLLDAGYDVVCIGYGLAPQTRYPVPVIQLGQALTFLRLHSAELGLDLGRVVLSGLSAGGQVVGQFANLQTNPAYARSLGLRPTLGPSELAAVLLDSAPLDLGPGTRPQTASWRNDLLFGLARRSYVGRDPQRLHEASITAHVTAAFPPTFVTDGNTGSFPHQAGELAARLGELGVRHELLLHPRSEVRLGHGFMVQPSAWTDDYNRRKVAFLAEVAGPRVR
jgi:acetyl esterase/lipase